MNPMKCSDPMPEDIIISRDALMVLTPRQREAIDLYRFGNTQSEISIELQITQSAVSQLLRNAIERMKTLY